MQKLRSELLLPGNLPLGAREIGWGERRLEYPARPLAAAT